MLRTRGPSGSVSKIDVKNLPFSAIKWPMPRRGIFTDHRKRIGVAGLAVLSAMTACQLVIGLDDPALDSAPKEAGTSTDANGSNADGTAEAGDPCNHVLPPPKGGDDDPQKVLPPITFAVHLYHLTGRISELPGGAYDASIVGNPPVGPFGFDLDNACTCQRDLHNGQATCTGSTAQATCDGDGGVDNGFAQFYSLFRLLGDPDDVSSVNTAALDGDLTVFFTLTNYNGLANDEDVSIAIAFGAQPDQAPDPRCEAGAPSRPLPDGAAHNIPLWDGCDRWHLASTPRSGAGYVVNHRVVTSGAAALPLSLGGAQIDVTEPVLVAVVVPHDDGSFTMEDGLIAGRVAASSAFQALASFKIIAGMTVPVCDDPASIGALKGTFCSARDIMRSKSEDNGGFDCDSLSLALSFRADPATLGDAGEAGTVSVNACVDAAAPLTCDLPDAGAD